MDKQYHNTTGETGIQLEAFTKVAATQDEVVLTFFKNYPNHDFSPSKLHEYLIKHSLIDNATPLTSIRRAFTNLTVAGKLVKTEQKVMSKYNRPEYIWKLKNNG